MNRDKVLRVLAKNPVAAGQVADAIRVGIVRGFFAVKNPQGNEAKIRALYRVPKEWKSTWMPDGSVVFAFPSRSTKPKRVHVTMDGKAVKYDEGEG